MPEFQKKTTVTLLPEWLPMLDQLKKEKFSDSSYAEMLRYVISLGVESLKNEGMGEKNDGEE